VTRRRARELSEIEIRSTEDVQAYARCLRDTCRELSGEVALTAHELRAALDQAGATSLDRFAARRASRRVTRRLLRASALLEGAGVEAARFWGTYLGTYEALVKPVQRKSTWRWQ
jgi:hypothetical protein